MAEIKTKCPHCGVRYWVDESFVSESVECEDCGGTFTIAAMAPALTPGGTAILPSAVTAAVAGRAASPAVAEAGHEIVIPDLGLVVLRVDPGVFVRGSDKGYPCERPTHRVRLTRPYWLGQHPVTQAEYEKVIRRNPSYYVGPRRPVESVTWYEAQEYCARLTERAKALGLLPPRTAFRLPTESEWEFGCLPPVAAGSDPVPPTEYCYGDGQAALEEYAWYESNSGGQTHPVAEKRASTRGLHDLHGNVGEWCLDWFGPYSPDECQDPTGPERGEAKVRRGGSWAAVPRRCRSSDRIGVPPDCRSTLVGFRVALASTP